MFSNLIKVLGSSDTLLLTEDYTFNIDDKQTIEAILVDELGHGVPNKSVNLFLDDVLLFLMVMEHINPQKYLLPFISKKVKLSIIL